MSDALDWSSDVDVDELDADAFEEYCKKKEYFAERNGKGPANKVLASCQLRGKWTRAPAAKD